MIKVLAKKIIGIAHQIGGNKIFSYLFYLLFSSLILRGILFSNGRIIGNDWGGLPSTISDIDNMFHSYIYTWSNSGNAFGVLSVAQNSLITVSIMKFFSLFGVDGVLFIKFFLLFVFSIAGYFMFKLLRSFRLAIPVSFLGGIMYITTPLFFNYTIMGWTYVLLFMAMLPLGVLYFIKANELDSWKYLVVVALIFEIMLLQSQAIVWFPLVLLFLSFYLISSRKTLLIYLKSSLILFVLTIFLNLWWVATTFFVKNTAVFSGDTLMTAGSLGASVMLIPLNIIRLYGSLMNSQFEYIVQDYHLAILSFWVPILVCISFLIKENRKLRIAFFAISLIPLFFYFLNFYRELLSGIPLINIVRDFGRFTVLSSFAIPVIVSLVLNYIYLNKYKHSRKIFYIILVIFFVYIFPWYGNFLTRYEPGIGEHQRIRTKDFPQEYYDLNYSLNDKRIDSKGLLIPTNTIVELADDKRFKGPFQEFYDTFFSYSRFHGWFPNDYNNTGYGDYFSKQVLHNGALDAYKNLLKLTDVSNIVVRTNMVFNSKEKIITMLDNDTSVVKSFVSDKIVAFQRKADNFLPHIYTPLNIVKSDTSVEEIPSILSEGDYNIRSVIYLQNQNVNKSGLIDNISETIVNPPTIEYKKINPTKYRVIVHGATDKFPLIFSESFHDGWKVYAKNYRSQVLKDELDKYLSEYKILDGNEGYQATKEDLSLYIKDGLISNLDLKNKKINHLKWENNKEQLDYVEKYKIDFISKNFQGTIQNDNLVNGRPWETWFSKKLDKGKNGKLCNNLINNSFFELPDQNHLVANGYANSWIIDPRSIYEKSDNCINGSEGPFDLELVVEFWPQRLFYVGALISISTLLVCVAYILLHFFIKKKLIAVKKLL